MGKVYTGQPERTQAPLPRSLEELDSLNRRDPERDEVCKRLSPEDQQRLMKRYGYDWP